MGVQSEIDEIKEAVKGVRSKLVKVRKMGSNDGWTPYEIKAAPIIVKVKVVDGGRMPQKKTAGAAAWDCYCRVQDSCIMAVNERVQKVPLGFRLEMPKGVAAFIVPRSSTGLKTHWRQPNSPAVIDSDYRGEVNALLEQVQADCIKDTLFLEESISNGDRLVQMLFNVPNVVLVQVDELSETERGADGFGSTGR